jgi:hypothetical protein
MMLRIWIGDHHPLTAASETAWSRWAFLRKAEGTAARASTGSLGLLASRLSWRAVAELSLCLCALIPVGLFLWFMPLLAGMLSELQPAGAAPDRPAALETRVGSLEEARHEAQRQAVDAPASASMHVGMMQESIVVVRHDRWLTEGTE